MKIKFWGVRGSIPTPYKTHLKYGGNTPCVEIEGDFGEMIILDAGTGIRKLGHEIMEKYKNGGKINIILTHTHWDHIQGLPFFPPIFSPKFHITFYGAFRKEGALRSILEGQMLSPYFPVSFDFTKATKEFIEVFEDDIFHIGGITISTKLLEHPNGCLGYRLEVGGKSICYCIDNEIYSINKIPDNVLMLSYNADYLIFDAQYTEEEYKTKTGWGHSTIKKAIEVAKLSKAKNLILFHHDPDHDDKFLDAQLNEAKKLFENIYMAREGLCIDIEIPQHEIRKTKELLLRKFEEYFKKEDDKLYIFFPKYLNFENYTTFKAKVVNFITDRIKEVILDFKFTEYIDSNGIALIVNIYKHCNYKNKELKAINMNHSIREIFNITKLNTLVKVI